MRKLSLQGLLLTILLMLSASLQAAAADSITASAVYDTDTMQIEVKGTSPASKGKYITLLAVHEDVNVNSLTDSSVGEYAAAYLHTLCGADGEFQFIFSIRSGFEKGKYIAYLSDELGSVGQATFPYAEASDTEAALADINKKINSKDENGVKTLLEQYETDLLLDFTEYSTLGNKKSDVAGFIIDQAPSGGYADISAFTKAYQKSVAMVAIAGADASDIPALLEKYAQAVEIDMSLYESLNPEAQKWAMQVMESQTYASPDDLAAGYREACICGLVSKPDNYKEIMTAVETTYKDDIGINLENNSDYKNLNDKSDVFRAMLDYDFDSYDAIREACLDAINDVSDDEKDGGKGSGSSGGGSGSGGGVRTDVGVIEGSIVPVTSPSAAGFTDLSPVPWARDAVDSLVARGIINGYSDGTFRPSNSVTRAEFTKMVVAALGLLDTNASASFTDVPLSHWAYSYVASGASREIIKGLPDGSFGAEAQISRQDMAVIVDRALSSVGVVLNPANDSSFADQGQISDYALESVMKLRSNQILTGDENGNFNPLNAMTRAEAAVAINRMLAAAGR